MTAYVIPPVNAEAINTSDARFGITDAMLISSSVPETPPAAYNAGTTYALGAEVSTGTVGGVISVWRSLQAGNTGNTPAEGTWWALAGYTYAAWNAATSYSIGDKVLRATTHRVYQRVTAGVTAQLPEDDVTAVNWSLVGTTNRWAMFDMLSSEPTYGVGPIVVKLAPGRISAVALVGASDGTAQFKMDAYGETVWDTDPYTLDTTVIGSWDDYFFLPFDARSNLVRLDAPVYDGCELTVTINAGVGFTLQWLVVGMAQQLGETMKGPRVRDKSYTTVDRDKFGEVADVTKRRSISLVSQSMYAEKSIIVRARASMLLARSTPSVFVGLDNNQDEYSDLLTLLGICIDSDIDLREPAFSTINLEIEGV